jgi:hypothetical protein
VAGVYEKAVDRESAYEAQGTGRHHRRHPGPDAATGPAGGGSLADEAGQVFRGGATAPQAPQGAGGNGGLLGGLGDILFGSTGPRGGRREGLAEAAAKSAIRTIGSSVGREIVRGVLGSLLGGSSKRR